MARSAALACGSSVPEDRDASSGGGDTYLSISHSQSRIVHRASRYVMWICKPASAQTREGGLRYPRKHMLSGIGPANSWPVMKSYLMRRGREASKCPRNARPGTVDAQATLSLTARHPTHPPSNTANLRLARRSDTGKRICWRTFDSGSASGMSNSGPARFGY